jgi:drug/metabolite transporter (DMT)-like permease
LKIPPYVFLVLATLFWAGNFTFGRVLSKALPPFGINVMRWIIACIIPAQLLGGVFVISGVTLVYIQARGDGLAHRENDPAG